MDPLTMSLLAGAGTAIGALPDIIPSKYERDQKKRLREMQRKQEMGALGLTEQQRSAIESQMRGARQQAQQYADAERARLTQPTAQPQMALLGQQMQDESRQRLEADLASQILNMDLQRQAQQEQEIKDLEAAQAQYRRARAEGLTAPFQAGAEAYVGQMGLERMISGMPPEQQQKALELMFLKQLGQRANSFGQSLYQGVQNAFASNPFASDADEISLRQAMSMKKPIKIKRPIESYSYDEMREMGMSDDEIQSLFEGVEIPTLGVKASDVANSTFGMY
tara:strand:+ start:3855 stop:4694 length:840 start_codon:yes stop_codon:yes gene_type:complete